MTKTISEIKKFIETIKINYRKGVDYTLAALWPIENFQILSPQLRKTCREEFRLAGFNDNLDYEKEGDNFIFLYRTYPSENFDTITTNEE